MGRYYIYSYLETLKNIALSAIPIFLDYLWVNILVGAITAVIGYIIIHEKKHSSLSRFLSNIIIFILFAFEVFVIFYFYNSYGIYSILFAFLIIFFIIIDSI